MKTDYKELARNAKKINGERRFVVDWAYHISKPTRCEMCGDVIYDGSFTRAWFEIGRQVYPDCISGNRKGITICNKHTRKSISEYMVDFFQEKINSDVRLKNCDKWSVRNAYEQHDKGVLEKVVDGGMDRFRNFVLNNINHRYSKCSDEKLGLERRVMDEIEKQYENVIFDREFRKLSDKELKNKLEDIEDMLLSTVKKKRPRKISSLDAWKERVGEYIQDLAVSRFLYNGEISNSSYFRKRLIKYVNKWNEKKFVEVRKIVRVEAGKKKERDSLKYKVKLANVISSSINRRTNQLSKLMDEINKIMEERDA